jgi:hypothetical protein
MVKINKVWIPMNEYQAYLDLKAKQTADEQSRMQYYMWNNYSMEGYEEWKLKIKNNVQTDTKEES